LMIWDLKKCNKRGLICKKTDIRYVNMEGGTLVF
jgi:hypothetical protein